MLIRFEVENFLSFNEIQSFSMIAGKSRTPEGHTIPHQGSVSMNILKGSLIFGANASGKSNFIKAIDFAKDIITKGPEEVNLNDKHFKLEPDKKYSLSKFEFEIKIGDKIFAYGFDISFFLQRISNEWLYEVKGDKDKLIFERVTHDNNTVTVDLDLPFKKKKDKERINYIGLDTLPNQLFLKQLKSRNVSGFETISSLLSVYEWFNNNLIVIYPDSKYVDIDYLGNSFDQFNLFNEILEKFNTGVTGVETITVPIQQALNLPNDIADQIVKDLTENENIKRGIFIGDRLISVFKDQEGNVKSAKLMTKHKSKDQKEEVFFDFSEESDGTQRLFHLIPILIAISNSKKVFIIDELERSLHANLAFKIVELFYRFSKDQESQLIVSSHESTLLNLKKLYRKDEIWFVEKNEFGESTIYSLDDFKPRYDKDIRKSYLLGRFGAIPKLSKLEINLSQKDKNLPKEIKNA